MDQIVNYATPIASIGLLIATCVLVVVTRQHARHAEKLAAAADRLGEILDRTATAGDRLGGILDRHAEELTEVTELHALVGAAAIAGGPLFAEARELVGELRQRRLDRKMKKEREGPTHES